MRRFLVIFIILILSFLVRVINISSNPPGLTPDEATLGYNAFSILKTGKDEYGTTLPIVFKSFGDYKPGLYVYLTAPLVAIFGLNEASVRLPSIIAGVTTVFLVYLTTKKLFDNEKLAIIAMGVAAINPWLIFFSRGAWEANVSLALTLAGVYFFLKSFTNTKLLILSFVLFAATLLTYQGAKISTLIVMVILLEVYANQVKESFITKNRRVFLFSFVICFIVSIPIFISFTNGQTQRLTVYSLFSYPRPEKELKPFLSQGGEKVGDESYYLFHSEKINFIRAIAGRYFNNFSGRFLFFEGDWSNPVNSAPNHGMLLITDIVFLPIGIYVVLKRKLSKESIFVLLWGLSAPLSAALSRDEVNAVRDLNLAIPLIIITAFGVKMLADSKYKYLLVIYVFGVIYLMDALFVHLPSHNSNIWRYGYKDVFSFLENTGKNKNIIIEQSFNQPYIYYLFYKASYNPHLDPKIYQSQEKLVESQYKGDVGFIEKLDNIEFKAIDLNALQFKKGVVFVGSAEAVPDWSSFKDHFNLLKETKYLDGHNIAFRIWEVK